MLSKLFRGKALARLQALYLAGTLDLPGTLAAPGAFERLMRELGRIRWLTYCKRPFAGPDQVFQYLGRYTHRVGLSNKRILHADDETVTIATRDGKTASMAPMEFLRRFLQHVLPKGYVKIRHYGLVASSNVRHRLAEAREAITGGMSVPAPADDALRAPTWRERLRVLTGVDLGRCQACGSARVSPWAATLPTQAGTARGPP